MKNNSLSGADIKDGSLVARDLSAAVRTGMQGAPGAAGPQGPTGPQGASGARGDTGARGDKGDTGAKGATGATGPQGPAGTPGTVVKATGASNDPSGEGMGTELVRGNLGSGTYTPLLATSDAGQGGPLVLAQRSRIIIQASADVFANSDDAAAMCALYLVDGAGQSQRVTPIQYSGAMGINQGFDQEWTAALTATTVTAAGTYNVQMKCVAHDWSVYPGATTYDSGTITAFAVAV